MHIKISNLNRRISCKVRGSFCFEKKPGSGEKLIIKGE